MNRNTILVPRYHTRLKTHTSINCSSVTPFPVTFMALVLPSTNLAVKQRTFGQSTLRASDLADDGEKRTSGEARRA